MIREMTLVQWIVLAGAFLLAVGPGYCLYGEFFANSKNVYKAPASLVIAFGFSVAFWVVLLLWLRVFHLHLTALTAFIISILGWLFFAFFAYRRSKAHQWRALIPEGFDAIDAAFFLLCFGAGLIGFRNEVVGMGSDSFHHTLIAQMINQQGQIPNGYEPYAPIITFSYHYGFHALTALLGWLSQWPLRLIIVALGPILVALTGFASSLVVRYVTGSRVGGLAAFAVVAILAVFPAYMLNWGRYPQLLGSFLLLLFLVLLFEWGSQGYPLRLAPLVALFAIGLSLTHYRITGMGIIGVLVFLLVDTFRSGNLFGYLRQNIFAWACVAMFGFVFIAPWVVGTVVSHREGFSIVHTGLEEQGFYSIERLGFTPLEYPTNQPLLWAMIIAVLYGFWKRDIFILWVTLWWASMYLMFQPGLLGAYFDSVTYYMSLYIPAGLLTGWLIAQAFDIHRYRLLLSAAGVIAATACLFWGVSLSLKIPNPKVEAFVHVQDMRTIQWIQRNTAEDALFMINTYNFPFSREFIIGIDAGYWLPILADRQTVALPMPYQIERFSSTQMHEDLVRLHLFSGHLGTLEAVEFLRKVGIDYVYIPNDIGMIRSAEVIASPYFRTVYEHDGSYVFQLVP